MRFICSLAAFGFTTISQAQDFTSPKLEAVTSWIGNSYGGGKKWVQQDIKGMCVMPDGTVFTNVPWDEAGGNVGEYKDGEVVRFAGHTHGWGNNGGEAVAANFRYLYLTMAMANEGGSLNDPATWPPKGSTWLGISRRLRTDISKPAPFEGGKGGKGDTLKSTFLVVAEVSDKSKSALPGICADETKVYVSNPEAGEIGVYDAETMKPLGQWKVNGFGPLTLDRNGMIWMLQRKTETSPAMMRKFNGEGQEQPGSFKFAANVLPVACCFSNDGRLLVADDSPAQQLRLYTVQGMGLQEAGVFGEKGGISSGVPGEVKERKLNQVSAIGCDGKGSLIVAHDAQSGGGGTVLESYNLASATLNWKLAGLTFVDMASVDPMSDGDVFTKEEHFKLDYAKAAGNEWNYAGYTIDRVQFPQDPRLHLWSAGTWVRRLEGQRLLFVNDMSGAWLQAYRFAPKTNGEVAIPSGLFAKKHIKEKEGDKLPSKEVWPPNQPENGEWIWRDANGNGAFDAGEFIENGGADAPAAQGWWVDAKCGVWLVTERQELRYFPCVGLDAKGNPQWDFKWMQTFQHADGFKEVKRVRYDSATDTLYLGGTTEEAKNQHWKPMGPVLACYDGWLKGAKKQRWKITLPYAKGSAGHESCEPMGFDVAGNFIFAPYTGASKKEGVTTGRVEIFRTSDGSAVGHVEPGAEVGEVGLQDLRETLTAHQQKDGEYIVMIEDDYKSKVVMYRLQGLK